MKITINILFISLLFLVQACKIEEKCGECFSAPAAFTFAIVDKLTGENLFTNGTYKPEQIEVLNLADNTKIEYSFIPEQKNNLIRIYSIGWKTEKINITVKVLNQSIFNMYVDAVRKSEKCCSFTEYNEVLIQNAEFVLDAETGIYTIRVDTHIP